MKSKVYYEVDTHNRLIIKSPPKKSNLKRFRSVAEGQFKTDGKNKLYYEVFKSSKSDTPQKIKFSGKYSLDKKHNLVYTLDKWSNQCEGNQIRLKTKLMDAGENEIMFLVQSRDPSKGKRRIYTMKLHGKWQADKNNRLCFGIERSKDSLTLSNAWQINKNNEIVYRYGRQPETVTLKGKWEIKDKHRLGYVLDKRLDSGFDFRTSLGQVVPKRKKIYTRFDIAIELSKRKRITRKLIFTGKLKLNKAKDLILEFSPRRKTTLKFTKNILDQKGFAYLESFLKDKEKYIGGGLVLRW
ncbi:MAG: hypothetical protein KKD11_03785 [Candidatus Omnitrophica bacterium]|nr:hypothetical protein [Candidatus Omnitrophota bacterium]